MLPDGASSSQRLITASSPAFLQIRGLRKTFGSSPALRGVDVDFRAGEIHGLVGHNGSGKSTLVKLLSGVHTADGGTISIDGSTLSSPVRPGELREYGLAFVHQDLGLVGECSVVENLRVGHYGQRRWSRRVDWQHERAVATATMRRMGADLEPTVLVSSLGPAEKGIVAVGRALQGLVEGTGCVVFDESTRAIPRELLPEFYQIVRGLAASGTSVVLVSHRLEEVLAVADCVTVLRDGAVVVSGLPTDGLSEAALAHLMLGTSLSDPAAPLRRAVSPMVTVRAPRAAPALRIRALTAGRLRGFDFDALAGEVVGITGPTNSGYADVPVALAAAAATSAGSVEIGGERFTFPVRHPRALIRAGLALCPEDRAAAGLALDQPAEHNLSLPRTHARGRFLLRSGWQTSEFDQATAMLGIAPAQPRLPCSSFSGGNQQKLLLAKWLLNGPDVLVLHEPTQAVDVGARADILRAIRSSAARGVAVVVVSSEPADLEAVCDRVVVIRDGSQHAELTSELSAAAIAAATYPEPVPVGPTTRSV